MAAPGGCARGGLRGRGEAGFTLRVDRAVDLPRLAAHGSSARRAHHPGPALLARNSPRRLRRQRHHPDPTRRRTRYRLRQHRRSRPRRIPVAHPRLGALRSRRLRERAPFGGRRGAPRGAGERNDRRDVPVRKPRTRRRGVRAGAPDLVGGRLSRRTRRRPGAAGVGGSGDVAARPPRGVRDPGRGECDAPGGRFRARRARAARVPPADRLPLPALPLRHRGGAPVRTARCLGHDARRGQRRRRLHGAWRRTVRDADGAEHGCVAAPVHRHPRGHGADLGGGGGAASARPKRPAGRERESPRGRSRLAARDLRGGSRCHRARSRPRAVPRLPSSAPAGTASRAAASAAWR